MKLLINFICITAGITLEAINVCRFWMGSELTFIFILTHLLAVFLVISTLLILLKNFCHRVPYSYILFLLSLSLLLPLLGVIYSCLLVFLAYRFNKSRNMHHIKTLEREYDTKPFEISHGAGEVRARLQSQAFPLSSKTAALFTMGSTKLDTANIVLQDVLRDEQEELRLLAFGLLNYQEKDIYKHIYTATNLLQSNLDPLERALLQKQIAELYWELVYRGLCRDMETTILEHAKHYAEEASKELGDYASIWVLLGKISHHSKNTEHSHQMFSKAKNLGAPLAHFVSYLAEHAYQQRKFSEVIDIFKSAVFLSDIPTIGPVVQFWIEEYDNKK